MAGSSSSSSSLTPAIPSDYFWLSPSFDPNMTLAVELRRMLQAHNVPLRNASTKADLVKLFKQRIQGNRPALLASVTPTPQAKPKPPKRGHRKPQIPAPAAESSSSSDASGEEEGSHDDQDNNDDDDDKQRNDNAANGVGAKQPPRTLRPRPTTAQKVSARGTNGARRDKDKGEKMSQLEAGIEGLMVSMDLEREHLQRVWDAMSTLLDDVWLLFLFLSLSSPSRSLSLSLSSGPCLSLSFSQNAQCSADVRLIVPSTTIVANRSSRSRRRSRR